jgi:pimeloyl-ACP methyl ester carboxylesterase
VDLSFESILTLKPFAEVARLLGVRLTIFGGLVRRLVRTAVFDSDALNSEDLLFSLTPFLSDIDVEHSGPPSLNARVRDELINSVPGVASIRIGVCSEIESSDLQNAIGFKAIVPVLSMSLASDGFRDSYGGVNDITNRQYRFDSNRSIEGRVSAEWTKGSASRLHETQEDFKVVPFLLFVKAVIEDRAGWQSGFEVEFKRALYNLPIFENGYLRSRLFELLVGAWAAQPSGDEQHPLLSLIPREVVQQFDFLKVGENIHRSFSNTLTSGNALIVSLPIASKRSRFPSVCETFSPNQTEESGLSGHPLDSHEECLLQSDWLDLSQGDGMTSVSMEFVHLLLQLPNTYDDLTEQEITACWLLKRETIEEKKNDEEEIVLPAPTVCHLPRDGKEKKLSIRSNLFNLQGLFVGLYKNVRAKILLLIPKRKSQTCLLIPLKKQVGRSGVATEHFVYVHGIRSTPSTFDRLRGHLENEANARGVSIDHYGFSYPYQKSMKSNGEELAKELSSLGVHQRSVTLFGHSMGGLISRFAILSQTGAYKFVKRLVMFGTPNNGAIRAASLTSMIISIMHNRAVAMGNNLRSPGVMELTNVQQAFRQTQNRWDQADGIEYITIPGTYFHKDRQHLDLGGASKMMAALGVFGLLLRNAYSPQRPHDGIVERESVDLLPQESGKRSEKRGPYRSLADPLIEYLHIHLPACDNLDHLAVHTDEDVLDFVSHLVFSKNLNALAGSQFERHVWTFM